ncbi:MAG TPA: DUF5916 domain-containing protein [Rhodanobacteraceae bacterium]
MPAQSFIATRRRHSAGHLTQCMALLLAVVLLATFAPAHARAATTRHTRPPQTIPSLSAWVGPDGKPTAAAWQHAARFAVDNEVQPGHNTPAPVRTDVDVGYTHDALWLRFVAQDPHPADIHVKFRQHDGFDNNSEYVGVIFSPFNDTQWGYEFFCSAGATEMDMFRQQGHEYASFDAIWYCRAQRTSTGYVVTMQIPFRSLKLPHSDAPQTWRLMLFRNWARRVRHQITQIKLDYNSNCMLCDAQVVRTATPIGTTGGGFQIMPQASVARTDARPAPGLPMRQGKLKASGGINARWAIRPDLVWSATLKPNFSQVAPDVLQPTINQRFALYYPENRPFFMEGTWVFNAPGFNGGNGATNQFVDTRQIADPHWATKVVGQVGGNAIGALVADDSLTNILMPGRVSSQLHSFNFQTRDGLLRFRHDFSGNSALGVLATSRTGSGYHNNLLAIDGTWQIDPSDTLTTQLASTNTLYPRQVASAFGIAPGRVTGNGWLLDYQRTRNSYSASMLLAHVAPGFRAGLGYLPQVGYDEAMPQFEYDWYAHDTWWTSGGFGGHYDLVRGTGGGPTLDRTANVYAFVNAIGQSHVTINASHENQYFGGKTFALRQFEVDANAQPLHWLQFEIDAAAGDGVDYVGVRKGRMVSIAPSFTLTPGPHLQVAFVGQVEHLDVDGGRLYTAKLYDLRLSWYFNARMYVRVIGQEQDVRNNLALAPAGTARHTRTLATQFLFGYVLNPWTSLYAGMTNGYADTVNTGLEQQGRTAFLRLSYAFQM